MRKLTNGNRAFTLIELLVVVAVLAVLAVIALPNLQLASARAKISRVEADFRTVSHAIETYRMDNAAYPQQNDLGTTPTCLSTPIAYLSHVVFKDPLYRGDSPDSQNSYYRYSSFYGLDDPYSLWHLKQYGHYWNYSNPPFAGAGRWQITEEFSSLVPYDATNGVISSGRIIRGQIGKS